ncbi:MAG: Rieske (2Fe-2S) protein [Acidobacteriota bacterium]
MADFVKAACVSDVPEGLGKTVEVAGRRVALFHVSGEFHAVQGSCPHRGGPLGEGYLRGTIVTCPWHFWQFDVVTGKTRDFPEACIETFPVKVEGDAILVKLPARPTDHRE